MHKLTFFKNGFEALSTVVAPTQAINSFAGSRSSLFNTDLNIIKSNILKGKGGKVNGISFSFSGGYGAKPRFDIHPLKFPSKATNKLTVPKIFKKHEIPLPHYHVGKGNNLRIHRPWEVNSNGKRIW